MKELIEKLVNIPDSYDDFLLGVISYAKKTPEHIIILKDFIDNNPQVSTSDVAEFIIEQPDFRSYSTINERIGLYKMNMECRSMFDEVERYADLKLVTTLIKYGISNEDILKEVSSFSEDDIVEMRKKIEC